MTRRIAITGTCVISGTFAGQSADHLEAFLAGESPLAPSAGRPASEVAKMLDFKDLPVEELVPKKSDRRSMGPSMLAGCCASGRALERAGLKSDTARLARTDLMVSCRITDRDEATDAEIIASVASPGDTDTLSAGLRDKLRPSLFLSQLPNLLAANISIVHGVTGTSQTFLGNDAAGADAVDTAVHRLRSGASERCLVGGVFRGAAAYLVPEFSAAGLLTDGLTPDVWKSDGLVAGSAAAFLLLETEEAATQRGHEPSVFLSSLTHRLNGTDPQAAASQLHATLSGEYEEELVVLTTATGIPELTECEHAFWMALAERGFSPPIRPLAAHWGALFEAAFPAALVAATACLQGEKQTARRAVVNSMGISGNSAMAMLEAA